MSSYKQYNTNNIVPDVAQPLSDAAVFFFEEVQPQIKSVYFSLMHGDVSEEASRSS